MTIESIDAEMALVVNTRNAVERLLDYQAATAADELPESSTFLRGLARRIAELQSARAKLVAADGAQ